MDKPKLYGRPGWGSAIVEAQLVWLGLAYDYEIVGNLLTSADARDALAPVNPLSQVPALILRDGRVLTESAAITLYLADGASPGDLVPETGSAERPDFLRWLVFLVANIYPTYTFADEPARFVADPAAAQAFRQVVDAHAQRLYQIVDAAAQAPWFLGERFSALDLYITVMTRWRPRRAWFAEKAPRLYAIARNGDALPQLAAVWSRNFPA